MPPQRTNHPAKPVKTERTHEENQERAYIAASRRSDRSLEARVESARRASEIHKRRTGRSLRVTEQDVINEEMYEEEDDDLPLQYRRLTAHLQTGSADFNRRLAAYVTNQIAMRSALDQAINHTYAQQYPNAPRFPHHQASMFPSPMLAPPTMSTSQLSSNPAPANATATSPYPSPMLAPPTMPTPQLSPTQTPTSPTATSPYRQSPYPIPGTPSFQRKPHMRSPSIAIADDEASKTNPSSEPGRKPASTPMTKAESQVSANDKTKSQAQKPSSSSAEPQSTAPPATDVPPFEPHQMYSTSPQTMPPPPPPPPAFDPTFFYGNSSDPFGPFSMSLPPESQLLLGPALDPLDPMTLMFMAGSENFAQPPWGGFCTPTSSTSMMSGATKGFIKPQNVHPSYDGVYSTLAPSALDLTATSLQQDTNHSVKAPVMGSKSSLELSPTNHQQSFDLSQRPAESGNGR
ncbi:MAG: hypothetical protein M1816_008179 [Peltula sp. TS41687]|nr:MAG: hypothetical protein M1816_008179 [Peltula sp. TS41687]